MPHRSQTGRESPAPLADASVTPMQLAFANLVASSVATWRRKSLGFLTGLALRRRSVTVLLVIMVLVGGLITYRSLPVELLSS